MPALQKTAKPAFDMKFESLGGYTDFCRRCFPYWTVCPETAFDETWFAAWAEHVRYIKNGILVPFFFVHDIARIVIDRRPHLLINSNETYFRLIGAVGALMAKWEAKGGDFVKDGAARGGRIALRPFFHEIMLAVNIKNVKSVLARGLDTPPKKVFEKEDRKKWLSQKNGQGATAFMHFFDANHVQALVDEAPELLERCLGLVRYEERLEEEGRRTARAAGASFSGHQVSPSDFFITDDRRGAFRRAVWAVAGDFSLLGAYRREAPRTPGTVAIMLPGIFSRPKTGGMEKQGLEHRVLGQGPPPGHPVSLAMPKPALMRLMAENKVPVYLDQLHDREPIKTAIIFCLHLPSATNMRGGSIIKNSCASCLKLAAFLAAHDVFSGLMPLNISSFDAAFFIYGANGKYEESGGDSALLAPALRATIITMKSLLENRRRTGINVPLLFDEPDVFPVLFNHPGPWSHPFVKGRRLFKAFSGKRASMTDATESVRFMMARLKNFLATQRQWSRKICFFMGGPGFAGVLADAAFKDGDSIFRFIPKKSDIFVVEAEDSGKGAQGPGLAYGGMAGAAHLRGKFEHYAGRCPYPYQGFRAWAVERILSSR